MATTVGSAVTPAQQQVVQRLVADLRSRTEETRHKAARDLFNYVSVDLREIPADNLNAVLDFITKHMLDTVKGDASAKLGGVLAIVALINALDLVDVCKTDTRISRFGNFLCNTCLASATDPAVIELAAKALARLTQVSGTDTANLKFQIIAHEVKRAFEVLQGPSQVGSVSSSGSQSQGGDLQRGDMRRYAAVLVLREIACCMPTFFFQNVSTFFDVIFNAIRDPRPALRESAVYALRAALIVTTQRETAKQSKHQHERWYNQCYFNAESSLDQGDQNGRARDDLVHGSLLVMAELLRCANAEWERINREMEDTIPVTDSHRRQHYGASLDGFLSDVGVGGIMNSTSGGGGDKPNAMAGLGGAMKRYYQSGLNRHARTGGGVTQIPFNWFGSVPVGREQIVESALLKKMLSKVYEKVCQFVLDIAHSKDLSKNTHVQKALLLILPKLAAFKREKFVSIFLKSTMAYMDKLLQGKDPSNAYIAIGLLAVATGADIQGYLKNVLTHIKQCLPSKEAAANRRRALHLDPAVFACISMLARAVRQGIKHEVSAMLDSMLSAGLSPALTTALYKLALYIPAFKKEIAEGLLKILSLILMQQPFRHPGTPKHLMSPSHAGLPGISQNNSSSNSENSAVTASIVLGLRTLGTFDFEGHSLLQFVRHCADSYLHSEEKLIRLEAVRTCSALLKGTLLGLAGRKSPTVQSTINEVLAKLLIVGITDLDADIRYCVMECLDECFDYHLAQAENLSALFVALNDEQFEIRELTMCIIGRLSILNPAYIMPSLRNTLLQLLTELDRSGIGRNKEQSARILGHLVANSPTLIRPYVDPILKVLIPKLKESESNPMVITSVLRAIGDLAQVGGTLMTKYVDELLPILLDILNDASSSQKREVSLWTLAQLVESTGSVVTPYSRYPNLLDTLLGFLRTEQRPAIRSQTLRLLGLLGALDPYKHKMNTGLIDTASFQAAPLIPINDSTTEMEQSYEMSPSEMLVNMGTGGTLDDFYPSVAIATLMKIIRDPTLARHHTEVVKAVTFIFKALGIKSVPYIAQVIPSMLNVIRSSEDTFRDFLFQQLGGLISIVRQHIRNYLDSIFDLIMEFWSVDSPLQPTIILLVENISMALGSEFKIYLPQLIPQILQVLMHDTSRDRQVTGKLLTAIQKFGSTLADYLHLFLPPIVRLFDFHDVPLDIRRQALESIERLSDSLDFSEFASRIIHPLVRCLDSTPDLRPAAMDTLAAIVFQLGKKYAIFVPMVHKVLLKHKITHHSYDLLCARVMQGGSAADFDDMRFPRHRGRGGRQDALRGVEPPEPQLSADSAHTVRKLPVSTDDLRRAWAVSRRVSKDDWLEWYGGLCREFLKASPSPALRACWTVAQRYAQLAKDLFNASFVSCWSELDANQQDELMVSLEKALTESDLPEISQTILNLAEFMEHCDKGPLPLAPVLLGEQAMKCRAYAKALHYKEDEFHRKPTVPVLEALIGINNKLGQKEAAAGLLQWGHKNLHGELKVKEHWYEKLNDWEKALEVYKTKAAQAPRDPELVISKMRCLEALGEWGQVHDVAEEHWDNMSIDMKLRMARMASVAAWGKQEWRTMANYVSLLPRESQDGSFYRAVLCVHNEDWAQAQKLIDSTRDMLDTEVTALSLESYQRAYPTMVCVQMLAELEEVIEYKLVPERRHTIKEMWWQRLQGCQRVVDDWQRILQVRSMVIKPHDDEKTWLKYASLCRKSGRLQLSHQTLVSILGTDPSHNPEAPIPVHHPQATLAYCKHLWATNAKKDKQRALVHLQHFVRKALLPKCVYVTQEASNARSTAAQQQGLAIAAANAAAAGTAGAAAAATTNGGHAALVTSHEALFAEEKECRQLLARCYLKLGQWQESLQGIEETTIPAVLQYYAASTEYDSNWYKAWHAWAVMNFETCLFYRHQQQQLQQQQQTEVVKAGILSPQMISNYAVPALKGFVRSITLSKGNSLQDTLRLLTLLFDYGHQSDMYEALHEGMRTIEIDNWLQVIPQLIARIDTPRPLVSRLIHQLLADLGKHHPQALVYSLTVACKSNNSARRNAANKILSKIREHSESLVNQALMASDELIRVAILWHEQWHEALEEASRLYFGERNIQGMLAKLEPLHAMLERGPQTLKETSFHQAYGNDLNEAKRWCSRYKISGNIRDLNQAWDLYYHVFRRISRQLPQLTQLELQYVSPKLLLCRDLELAVPGSYTPMGTINRISQVEPSLQVITSKQRPRKLSICGSNGRTYMFLLKGHEDLRQDERVMQFFSLVNSLLVNDPETFRRNLAIQRFAVIPLSTNSGLIGWVPHSDTLHGLIKDYREKKKILLNIEHRLMQRMSPDYDHLPLMNKVEVFEHSLEHTQGDDLAKLLLLKSPSSEVWFDRRTNFTRSLAVMSMVGYVLGLGDRHPSNLLLDRMSGKILHIDFGDCFEVAMTREKFPEKIPFRLTRMLINAMEVTGIEGTYRSTCESVMTVLRHNKDSLMAVLEAFVYDPLLNWRLIETGTKGKKSKAVAASGSTGGVGASGGSAGSSNPTDAPGKSLGQSSSVGGEDDLNPLSNDVAVVPMDDDTVVVGSGGPQQQQPEALNKKALDIVQRVRDKLTGRDFDPSECLEVSDQVDLLIRQATNNENLCQCYIGWCPFW